MKDAEFGRKVERFMEVNTALGEVMDCMIPEHKKIFLEYVALQEELHLRMIELACQ